MNRRKLVGWEPTDVPLGKGALKRFGSLLGQGDFGELSVKSGGVEVGSFLPPTGFS